MSSRIQSPISLPVAALLAVCTAAGAGIAQASPAAGDFLVASRQQQGDFSRSVVLLLDYGPSGAFGLVVNRPTALPLAKLLPGVSELQGRRDPLYVGGPVAVDHLILLIRAQAAPPDAVRVMDGIYVSGSIKALRAVAGDKHADTRFRGYAGYAGWGPGQLDAEIANGDWLVVPADPEAIFTQNPTGLWNELIQTENTKLVQLQRTGSAFGQ